MVLARNHENLLSWHAKALNDAVLLAVSQADYVWGEPGALSRGDILPIRSLLTEAEALFKEIGEMWGIAECYQLLGRLTLQEGNVVLAHTRLSQSLTLFRVRGE